MQWTQIDADADPGETFAADVPGGVLVRTVGPSTTSALVFLPGAAVATLIAAPPPPRPARVDPDSLAPDARALWDQLAAADPRVTELSPDQFDLVQLAVAATGGSQP
jgi:hypothetical protein